MNRKPRPSWHCCECRLKPTSGLPVRRDLAWWRHPEKVFSFMQLNNDDSNTFLLIFSPNPLVFSWKTTSVSTFLSASPLLLLSPTLSQLFLCLLNNTGGWWGNFGTVWPVLTHPFLSDFSPTKGSPTSSPLVLVVDRPGKIQAGQPVRVSLQLGFSNKAIPACGWNGGDVFRKAEGLRFQEEANRLTLQKEEGSTGAERNSSSLCGCGPCRWCGLCALKGFRRATLPRPPARPFWISPRTLCLRFLDGILPSHPLLALAILKWANQRTLIKIRGHPTSNLLWNDFFKLWPIFLKSVFLFYLMN